MITPKRPSGFNELLPADQLAFNAMVSVIKLAYEQYGYAPIETPALELASVLLAKEGGETAKQVYRFTKGDTDLAMRFDLTIPLARYAAEHYNELAFPFRRYQIQEVWRAEKAQAGRYRQFYQCDIDILGSNNALADIDVLLAAHAALRSLGLSGLLFRISHRGIITAWLEEKKLSKHATIVLRAIDKLEKIGARAVTEELINAGIKKTEAGAIVSFVSNSGKAKEVLKFLKEANIQNENFKKALESLELMSELLVAGGMKSTEFVIDLSIARGFDYYTGMVFETVLVDQPKIGSICSGGRYDNLLGQYRKDPIPGVGASIGLSRLFAAIKEKMSNGPSNPAQVLIIPFEKEVGSYSLEVAIALRRSGLNVLVYPNYDKISKQLGYADKLGIPAVILIGGHEKEKNMVTIKNMKSGDQKQMKLDKVAAYIKKMV